MSRKLMAVWVGVVLILFSAGCGSSESLIPEGETAQVPGNQSGPVKINLMRKLGHSQAILAVVGDSRKGDSTFEDIEEDIYWIRPSPDLVAHTGDMINNPGSGIEWYNFHKIAKTLTDHFSFYPVPGNHDVDDEVSQKTYQHQFPAPVSNLYYELEYGDLLLIFLDTELAGQSAQITGDQFAWLERELRQKGDNFRYRMAFLHEPLFPTANHLEDSLDKHPQARDRLHRLFIKYRVNPVFVGHEHIYDRTKVDGVTYITTGGAGAELNNDSRGFYHFVYVAETDLGLQGYCFTVDGIKKDQFVIK